MSETGEGESPQGELTPQSFAHREHADQSDTHSEIETRQRNPFTECIAGEKPPYTHAVFTRVYEKLNAMMDDSPGQDWYWTRLGREDKDDMQMVFLGFCTVAYDRLGVERKATVKSELYSQATGEGDFGQWEFEEDMRFYNDRFELTYRQAHIVQKTMRYLAEDYDPGGEENIPANLAKRTFYYDDYLAKPLTPDYPGQSPLKTSSEKKIAEYLQSKKR